MYSVPNIDLNRTIGVRLRSVIEQNRTFNLDFDYQTTKSIQSNKVERNRPPSDSILFGNRIFSWVLLFTVRPVKRLRKLYCAFDFVRCPSPVERLVFDWVRLLDFGSDNLAGLVGLNLPDRRHLYSLWITALLHAVFLLSTNKLIQEEWDGLINELCYGCQFWQV